MKAFYPYIKIIFTLSLLNTKEWIYLRFFQILLFFSLVLMVFGFLLSHLTFAAQDRLFYDFSFAGLELCLVFLVTAIGSHALQREIDRRTMYVLLVRPIPKWTIIVSILGSIKILSILFIIFFIFSALIASSFNSIGSDVSIFPILIITFITYLKSLLIASFAICLSLLVRPILSLVMSIGYWLLNYSAPDLIFFLKKNNWQLIDVITQGLDYFIPQFYRMNWKAFEFVAQPPTTEQLVWSVFHCLAWILFWTALSSYLFQRKEIG